MKKVYILIIAATVFYGCASSRQLPEKQIIPLKNTRWEIFSINKNIIDSSSIYIILKENGKLIGNAGCNSMGGLYIEEGTSIIFSQIISTKMYCSKIEQENLFLKALPLVDTYFIKNNELIFFSRGKEILKFMMH